MLKASFLELTSVSVYYTTLVVEFVGEMNRFIPPVVISTSQEGEVVQGTSPVRTGSVAVYVEVVPTPVLNEITELPLLKRALDQG
jgi:hypothetical protein